MKTKRVCLCSCFPQTTQCTLNVVICLFIFLIKGLLCSFGTDISIRRERSSLTNFLNTETNYVNKPSLFSWQDKLNKQTDLKGQPDFMLFYFFFFFLYVADSATFLASNGVLGPYFPLKTACLFTYGRIEIIRQNYIVPLYLFTISQRANIWWAFIKCDHTTNSMYTFLN